MQDRIFYSTCLGFALGVLFRSFVFINFYFIVWLCLVSFLLIFFHFFISKNRRGIIAGIFVLMFSLGILRFHLAEQPAPEILESKVGQRVSLSGEIVDEPNIGENNQKLAIKLSRSDLDNKIEEIKILLSTGLGATYKYGDKIKFFGKLQKPENFITDQGKEFDYVNYLRKDGIFYVMNYANIEIVSRGNGNFIKSGLFFVKEKFLEKINNVISSPENLLMGGLILGEKSSFDKNLRQSFVNTGTIHIVALSGYNVTIVAEWIMKLFAFLPKSFGIWTGILAIFLFILMTGGSSTAIRAGVMAILALIARATGRNYDVARALILALIFMILINPFVLVYDVSFQLSFIATVAVIFFTPKIEKYFLWVTDKFQLRDIVSVTFATYVFVAPFILYKMGNFSLVALPANILILPLIPFTMMLGFVTGFAGFFSYILSIPIGYISYLFLHYELGVIGFFSNLSFSSFSFPNFPLFLTLLIYMYFIYMLFGRSIKNFLVGEF